MAKVFLPLCQLLYVLSIKKNLTSVGKLAKRNFTTFEFHATHYVVKSYVNNEVLVRGYTDPFIVSSPSTSSNPDLFPYIFTF